MKEAGRSQPSTRRAGVGQQNAVLPCCQLVSERKKERGGKTVVAV